jgi:hypothetical protein
MPDKLESQWIDGTSDETLGNEGCMVNTPSHGPNRLCTKFMVEYDGWMCERSYNSPAMIAGGLSEYIVPDHRLNIFAKEMTMKSRITPRASNRSLAAWREPRIIVG